VNDKDSTRISFSERQIMALTVTKKKTRGCPEYEDENLSAAYLKVIHDHLLTISTIKKVLNSNKI
jgi:hypothetical protein